MSLDLFKKIVDDMKAFPKKIRVVHLHMFGEPLLNPDFCKMVRYLKDSNVCNEIRTFTNGSMLTPELNQALVDSGLDYIRISVESLYEDDYANMCKYKMNLEKFIDNIRDLYDRSRGTGLRVGVKIVDGTLRTIEDVNRFFETYANISDYHYTEKMADRWVNFEVPDAAKAYVSFDTYVKEESQSQHLCAKSFFIMCVCANGEVTSCSTDWQHKLVLGDVAVSSLKEIWNSEGWKEFQRKQLRGDCISVCHDCKYWISENLEPYRNELLDRLEDEKCNMAQL